MKPTTEGSNAMNFDMVCMSFGKENEKGLRVVQGASKNSIFDEEMIIKAEDGKLMENNTIQSSNGIIIDFKERALEIVKENRKARRTKSKKVSKTDREIR